MIIACQANERIAAMAQTTAARKPPSPPVSSEIGQGKKNKVWGKPFQKGVSGNPGGRRGKEKARKSLMDIAQDASEDAVKTLISIMKDKTASAAVRAYCSDKIMDRAYGKATQQSNLTINSQQRPISSLSDAELMAIISAVPINNPPPAALPPPSDPQPDTIEGEVVTTVEDAAEPDLLPQALPEGEQTPQ